MKPEKLSLLTGFESSPFHQHRQIGDFFHVLGTHWHFCQSSVVVPTVRLNDETGIVTTLLNC
jgi:hypothetical protein